VLGVGRLNGTAVLGQGVLLCKYSSGCWCWQAERYCSAGTGCAAAATAAALCEVFKEMVLLNISDIAFVHR